MSSTDPGVSIQKRVDRWNMDLLGNWSTQPSGESVGDATVGRYTFNGDGLGGVSGFLHAVDNRNQIASFIRTDTPDAGSPTTTTLSFVYDLAGNLVFDGMYFYQYDAWNHLLQVNEKGSLTSSMFDAQGNLPSEGTGAVDPEDIGPLVKHHVYDGLGRLVRTASPVENPEHEIVLVTERYYYDGIRRIQEVLVNPLESMIDESFAMSAGLSSVLSDIVSEQSSAAKTAAGVDRSVAALGYEQAQMELSLFSEGEEHMPLETGTTLAREYIWGPGDRGTDELLVQFDTTNKPWYVIQDGGGDITAIVQPAVTSGSTSPARVVAQYVYDPYGAAISVEHLYAHPYIHAGHKGLFVERLDQPAVAVGSGGAITEIPRLVPLATNYVHMRNRAYAPGLGRFFQRDMNATGSSLNSVEAYHGAGAFPTIMAMDMNAMYGNGLNLYQYLGSNPWLRHDPMGLAYDPFDMVDDYMAQAAADRAAFMSRIGRDTAAAAVVAATIASYLPFPGAGLVGDLALTALGEQTMGETAIGMSIGLIPGGKLMSFVGKMSGNIWNMAKQYAMKGGGAWLKSGAMKVARWTGEKLGGVAERARFWVAEKKTKYIGCGCFVAGTTVWAATGMVPIEAIKVHDEVYAQNPATGQIELREVTAVMEIPNAGGLQVAISHMDGSIETISATDEHPFWVESDSCTSKRGEWRRADSLREGDAVRTLQGVAIVEKLSFSTNREAVYNFTVAGLGTYHVGPNGVLVHNCTWAGDHHLLAKYMQGDAKGATRYMTHDQHVLIHQLIDKASDARGIPTRNMGKAEFADWLRTAGPEGPQRATEALIEAYSEFDRKSGTNFTAEMLNEIMNQQWLK